MKNIGNRNGWKVLLAAFLLAMPNAQAGNRKAQERAAKKACMLGDSKTGTEILADLYISTGDPNYIWNQARCFEQNGENEKAILRFQEFLRKDKTLSATDADETRKKIDTLQAAVDRRAKALQPEPAPVPAPAKPLVIPASAARAPEPVGLTQPAPTPAPPETPPVYRRWWFWTGIGAVLAAGAVTGFFLLRPKSGARSPQCEQGPACALP
jgi:hypothetical protein